MVLQNYLHYLYWIDTSKYLVFILDERNCVEGATKLAFVVRTFSFLSTKRVGGAQTQSYSTCYCHWEWINKLKNWGYRV